MISVIVVLSSAKTKKHYPLGSITISNRGQIKGGGLSDYDVRQMTKEKEPRVYKTAEVLNHARGQVSVWKLVAKALSALGHGPTSVHVEEVWRRDARIEELEREVEVLRQYGNKDCTAMADEALAQK
jgi:hypothetical protein